MFTLKSLQPSRTSLTIPTSPSRPPHSTQASPLASPSSSTGARSPVSATSAHGSYFASSTTPVVRAQVRQVPKEEALKTVRCMEDLLTAWNEWRMALSATGKAGRKLASAMKDLAGCMDKSGVAAQTIRPTAVLVDDISDTVAKLAKRVDKEYDEANSDASKYFTLLAKESRTHDAYLGAIGKKHDKAEKAYKKATKSLSDTSGAHAGLLSLKDTLSADIGRAQEDHHLLIGTKQSAILLRLASSSGVLACSLLSFFSDGLRKTGASFPDIEYFRSLADVQWQSSLPQTMDEAIAEDERRDAIRLTKARVALGESETVGERMWQGAAVAQAVEPTSLQNGQPALTDQPKQETSQVAVVDSRQFERDLPSAKAPSYTSAVALPTPSDPVKADQYRSASDTVSPIHTPSINPFVTAQPEPAAPLAQPPRTSQTAHSSPVQAAHSPQASSLSSSSLSSPTRVGNTHTRSVYVDGTHHEGFWSHRHGGARGEESDNLAHREVAAARDGQPSARQLGASHRSVSQMDVDLQNRHWSAADGDRGDSRPAAGPRIQPRLPLAVRPVNLKDEHRSHVGFVRGCELCAGEYDSVRVTMPPTYSSDLLDHGVPANHLTATHRDPTRERDSRLETSANRGSRHNGPAAHRAVDPDPFFLADANGATRPALPDEYEVDTYSLARGRASTGAQRALRTDYFDSRDVESPREIIAPRALRPTGMSPELGEYQ
ncbi:hypothetical protein IAU60_002432 [Kwoniella sp. DSM 27419]